MALNSNNQFENFVNGAPLTHSTNSPVSLEHVTPYKYQDDKTMAGDYVGNKVLITPHYQQIKWNIVNYFLYWQKIF